MSILKVNPPYRHFVQKRQFCGPTCIQMILFRRGFKVNQERLAYNIGTFVDVKDRKHYSLKFKTAHTGDSRIGIMLKDFEKPRMKSVLKKYGLRVKVYRVNQINNVPKFLETNIRKNKDTIINFWWKPIDGTDWGHHVLLSKLDTKKRKISVCDPGSKKDKFWTIKIDKLVKCMSKEFDGNERGFVVIS
ncbi:MAG: C39 family peptidase [Candidatus Aenigmarchaeota archaeon]|nr:C39 family peptidase [Candidatus Aenigmarchaeota archaeon]